MALKASELTAEQKLHRKLFEARKAAEPVEKQGYNEGGGFSFARAEHVLAEASKQLEKRGMLIVPQVVDEQLRFGRSGFCIATVVMEFQVIDTKDGGSISLRWSGTGYDAPGDKASFKAQTGCEKYFLAKLLGIPFGTDPEAEERPSHGEAPAAVAESEQADQIRAEQDKAAEAPDMPPALRPVPKSDLPEPDWAGLTEGGADDAAA